MSSSSASVVIEVRSNLVVGSENRIDMDMLHQMFEAGLEALSGNGDYIEYLRKSLGAGSTVGIKVNTLGGPGMSTRVETTTVLSNILMEAGMPGKKQITWDRTDRELSDVGFKVKSRGDGPYCFGTDHDGVGYASDLVTSGQVGGLLSRILVDYCDVIVNVPVLKDHGVAGITGSLKNHYGSIHNPNKYHSNGCNPYVADLNSLEQIKSRQRLIVMDALRVQYHGGPAYQPRWAASYGALLFGTDPVAVDSVGYDIIEGLRLHAGLEPLKGSKREPAYIKTAADRGLGNNDSSLIELRRIKI